VVAAAPTGTCPEITFVLQGSNITVKTDSRTNFRSRCSDVGLGDTVEVMGRLLVVSAPAEDTPPPGSTILADKIEITKAAPMRPCRELARARVQGSDVGPWRLVPRPSRSWSALSQSSRTARRRSSRRARRSRRRQRRGEGRAAGRRKVLATKIARE